MIRRFSILPIVLALGACGIGGADFTENADVAPAVLYGAFSELTQTGSGLAALGLQQSQVRAERVGENDLLLTVPSTEKGSEVTFRLHFACRETRDKTQMTAKIKVPEIRIGSSKVLDRGKVERFFHSYSQALIKAKEQGNSTLPAAREFASLFDALRMIANPALRDQIKSIATANGEPMPLFGDEAGPPAGFGQNSVKTADAGHSGKSSSGRSQGGYQAWAQQAAAEDADEDEASSDR